MQAGVITMQEIFKFEQHGVDAAGKVVGEFKFTGIRPARARSHRALRHQPRRDHQAVPVRTRRVKFILIGVCALTAVALLEALVYTMRFLSDRRNDELKRRLSALGSGSGGPQLSGVLRMGKLAAQPGHRRPAALA